MRAHIFDMDGTLLRRTSAPVLLAAALGGDDALVELEDRFATGAATAWQFAQALHELWGIVPSEVAQRAFAGAPLIANIREVLADIAVEGPDLMLAYRAARERCDRQAEPPPPRDS